jgi:monofunctional glycosyltransferase
MIAMAARSHRSLAYRISWLIGRLILYFIIISVLWVVAYKFIAPPFTFTMMGDAMAGRSVVKEWMNLSDINPVMARAVIAAEDAKFCQHGGFDREAITAAAKRNARGGRVRGGSTISQQTAKNAFLWQNGGYLRKGLEAWFTLLIENIWGKKRIMEVYLNIAETGVATYGVNAASKRYFGHDASVISPAQAARIAAILPLPKKREAIAPQGYTKRYGNRIRARTGVVKRDALDACLG